MHLHLTESSARPGMQVTAEAEREYWMSRQKAAVKAPAEIDVHAFRLRDVCNLSHAQIKTRIKEGFNLFQK